MHSSLDIKDRLQSLIINQETDYAKSIYKNPVKEYIDLKRSITEKKIMDRNNDSFEENRFERSAKQGFASLMSSKLISELIISK